MERHMEFSQIKYFILTAQLQNMSQAALALNISQPTLSKSIANLEKELGTTLFDRIGRKLILNEQGRTFLEGAILSVDELERTTSLIKNTKHEASIKICLFHMSDKFFNCLSAFSEQHPSFTYEIVYMNKLIENIDTNAYDMLLYPKSSFFRKYKGEMLYREKYYAAMSRKNPLSLKKCIYWEDLRSDTIVYIRHDSRTFENPYYIKPDALAPTDKTMFVNSHEIQWNVVSRNMAVGFVEEGRAQMYESNSDIALIPMGDCSMFLEIMVGFKRDKHLSRSGKQFAEFIKSYFEGL